MDIVSTALFLTAGLSLIFFGFLKRGLLFTVFGSALVMLVGFETMSAGGITYVSANSTYTAQVPVAFPLFLALFGIGSLIVALLSALGGE